MSILQAIHFLNCRDQVKQKVVEIKRWQKRNASTPDRTADICIGSKGYSEMFSTSTTLCHWAIKAFDVLRCKFIVHHHILLYSVKFPYLLAFLASSSSFSSHHHLLDKLNVCRSLAKLTPPGFRINEKLKLARKGVGLLGLRRLIRIDLQFQLPYATYRRIDIFQSRAAIQAACRDVVNSFQSNEVSFNIDRKVRPKGSTGAIIALHLGINMMSRSLTWDEMSSYVEMSWSSWQAL